MGCDIHSFVEVRRTGKWHYADDLRFPMTYGDPGETTNEPFFERDYGLFGFLGNVRNYSHSPVVAAYRGLPDDLSTGVANEYREWDQYAHSDSWVSLAELLAFDYDQIFWDRRVMKETSPGRWDGAALAEEGEGTHLPLREFLGSHYFDRLHDLAQLGDPGDVRVVFWFDS
jgi:hypothetical protein